MKKAKSLQTKPKFSHLTRIKIILMNDISLEERIVITDKPPVTGGKVTYTCGVWVYEKTAEEVSKMQAELQFLSDSILVLLNPEYTDTSDIPFDYKTTIKYLKEYFYEPGMNYNKEFLDNVFSKVDLTSP
jgi:hypothetical protein